MQNFSEPFSELESNYSYFVVLTIFNQSSFILLNFHYWNCKPPIWLSIKKDNQFLINKNAFNVEMATRNKTKLAAINKENCHEHLRSNLAKNSNVLRSQEDYITQVSEIIEGRVTKKLSQELCRTKNRILGELARLGDSLTNPLSQGHSWTAPETSRNFSSTSQGTN